MPEFILTFGSNAAASDYRALSCFEQGYIEAAFFTETGTGDDPELEHATFGELATDAIEYAKADCGAFLASPYSNKWSVKDALHSISEHVDYDMTQAGRDFWYTRNGHGVGYWDRPQLTPDISERISDIACKFGAIAMYRGDDGAIYFS